MCLFKVAEIKSTCHHPVSQNCLIKVHLTRDQCTFNCWWFIKITKDGEKENNRTTHSGVLEFTTDEGLVGIPPHIWSNLFLGDTPKAPFVEVRYVRLAKGAYAKLQPDGIGFSDLPNHKAILETSLRQHGTLSQDDVLTIKYGELTYRLHVLELKPSTSIFVLETGIELDIVNLGVEAERTDQCVLKPLVFGTSEFGLVQEGNYMYYKFSIGENTWEKIACDDVNLR
ncbi:Ubiquitin fusion degradation 1 [Gossypium australe]|uniref:Ubiquitin fusion degradation 1 n=1 Tax=Gossypium australe TaxID=47621 RepID=A0A5B6VZ24_9ROSI|nr:Ubiquitin fusion degradation 1 [Gossypium australe]